METSNLWDEFSNIEGAISTDTLEYWCSNNGEYGEQIRSEWSDKNVTMFGDPLNMNDVYYKSTDKYWWHCSFCGNDYYSQLFKRLYNHRGCPHCSYVRQGITLSKSAAEKNETIWEYCRHSEVGDVILSEWDTVRNKKEGLSVDTVTPNCNKEAWWICSNCGCVYKKMIYKRVKLNNACRKCSVHGTSLSEQLLYRLFKQVDAKSMNREYRFGYEYDIIVPKANLFIEFDGVYWHMNKVEHDTEKENACRKNNVNFVRIQALNDMNNGNNEYIDNNIIIHCKCHNNLYRERIFEAFRYICSIYKLNTENIDYNMAVSEAYDGTRFKYENSVAYEYPELVQEFDNERNKDRDLRRLSKGSSVNIVWKCTKCGANWITAVSQRTWYNSGCINCGYNIFDKKYHDRAIKKKHVYHTISKINFL